MKRALIALAITLVPLWACQIVFAAGFFKVGEPLRKEEPRTGRNRLFPNPHYS